MMCVCSHSIQSERCGVGPPQGRPVLYSVAHTEAILLGQACRVLKSSCLEGWDMLLTLEFPLCSPCPLPTVEMKVVVRAFSLCLVKFLLTGFLYKIFNIVCMCMSVCAHVCVCVGQRTAL